jgi:hypothetical protein
MSGQRALAGEGERRKLKTQEQALEQDSTEPEQRGVFDDLP